MKNINKFFFFCFITFLFHNALADNEHSYVTTSKSNGSFTLVEFGKSSPFYVSSKDFPGVIRVLKHLQTDIYKVTNSTPVISLDDIPSSKEMVIVGTIGRSALLDELVKDGKLSIEEIKGKWETFLIEVIDKPFPNVDRALIIAGSDKRGTIYGIYDLSQKIGVSPWYWWADVPVKKNPNLYVLPGRFIQGEPKVKYRGIFINDEAPALSGWSMAKYGTDMFNHELYEHVFELILRLKGNFLWPAMWGRAFYDDDSLNAVLADEYGIVIGTSHHEPMMRAHVEWQRYGSGPWNYEKNEEKLRQFWREGVERTGNNESIVTLAMRGDGDEAMSEEANIDLLEKIVKDQREIIQEVTGKEIEEIPQVWALYKEVQEYYDKGMRVPDDVTILLCDDNWGNIRKLPMPTPQPPSEGSGSFEKPRKGGYGIYYHYDFVGGPRNYKWLNTNQIERVWEQMHLAYEYGARQIWIVNVGDIKPMEFPIDFFLDYAWNPHEFHAEHLPEYYRLWAEEQFGNEYSKEIAEIISKYTKYNSRRKPELLSPGTYSLINYREAETIVAEYNELAEKAQIIYNSISAEYKDAFYQLVLHPVIACANLNEMYVTVGKNHLYAKQGRALTNSLAEKVEELFNKDAEITNYYNTVMANGKWNHMMDQTHIGYTSWQQPDKNIIPKVKEIEIPTEAEMGVAIEGAENWWPNSNTKALLPEFDVYNRQSYYIEIFNRGQATFNYTIETDKPWVLINKTNGSIGIEERLWVNIDWNEAPVGRHQAQVTISGPNKNDIVVIVSIDNPKLPKLNEIEGFVESNGYVSIEAEHYNNTIETSEINWQIIPNLGRTLSAITPMPVTAESQTPGGNSPRLEYKMYLFNAGEINVDVYLSPTLNFSSTNGLRYAVSFNDEQPQIVNFQEGDTVPDWKYPQWWNQAVSNNIRITTTQHSISEPGEHVLKFWMVDPGVVLQKLVVKTGEVKPGYLGPPESFYKSEKTDLGKK